MRKLCTKLNRKNFFFEKLFHEPIQKQTIIQKTFSSYQISQRFLENPVKKNIYNYLYSFLKKLKVSQTIQTKKRLPLPNDIFFLF